MSEAEKVTSIEHAGSLEDLVEVPPFILPPGGDVDEELAAAAASNVSCSYCGVGDSGIVKKSVAKSGGTLGAYKRSASVQKLIVSHHIQCFLRIAIGVLVSNGAA